MTQYPRDEFDDVPESTSRQGVHREHLVAPRSGALGMMILAGLLALLVGLAAYFVLPRLGIADDDTRAASATSSPAAAAAGRGASPSPSAGAVLAEATPKATPASEATGGVDESQSVAVLNATSVPGPGAYVAQRTAAAR